MSRTRVGARRTGLEDLVGIRDEVLAQHGNRHGRAHQLEVLERTAEPPALGEHADGAGSPDLVGRGESRRVGDVGERAPRRARPLHLCDDLDPVGGCERAEYVEGGRACGGGRLDVSEADGSAAIRSILEGSGNEL